MFLLDKPFVSDYLIKTIRENNYNVISTPVARALIKKPNLSWISEEEAIKTLRDKPDTPLYSNSENALGWVTENLHGTELDHKARLFKDKIEFRKLLEEFYPDFQYKSLALNKVQRLNTKDLSFPFVIKPSIGFFSIGVFVVKNKSDWEEAKKQLNPENLSSQYPKNVLNASKLIIEEYIEGEEYAIDCYFNKQGKVVILNILHHKFSSGADTSDRVYSTSKKIVLSKLEAFEVFLGKIGKKAKLKNFPAHVEVRINEHGEIIPIEINPVRFGGWCTTADLLGLAIDYNSYACYHQNRKPDWEKIFEGKEKQTFSLMVLNNNSGYSPASIKEFNYEALAEDFEKPVLIRKMDVKKHTIFGFLFTETSPGNEEELGRILVSDLKSYITLHKL